MLEDERRQVAAQVSALAGLTPGRTGNLSVRRDDRVAITPSGVPYDGITPEDVPVVSLDGEQLAGENAPSSETPMHRGIYERLDAGAVVHAHSPWVTTLAVLREPLPAVHYLLAMAGRTVPVAEYATYGTTKLAANAVEAMEAADSRACVLANHGLVAYSVDPDPAAALETAVAVESVARVYCQARMIGEPIPLEDAELDRVADKLADYGPQPDNGP